MIVAVVSRSPPSIPHTEHPIAYKGERLLMVKFLEPHGFTLHMGPASVSVPASRNQPAPTPIALGSPAMQAIPSTFASSSIFRGALTVGSPSLPIGGSRIRRDTPYPMYEFKLEKGVFIPIGLSGHMIDYVSFRLQKISRTYHGQNIARQRTHRKN